MRVTCAVINSYVSVVAAFAQRDEWKGGGEERREVEGVNMNRGLGGGCAGGDAVLFARLRD
mgnify:CR=1 FL=1